MSLLQYSSKEMFSATDLVRRNKPIFDKLNSKEIEKAVILKDGKPSIILLDFSEYEKLIEDYLILKNKSLSTNHTQETTNIETKSHLKEEKKFDKISEDEYKIALNEIEKLSANLNSNSTTETNENSKALKEFWEK
ncbi:hypothetical protein [Aliarcobacter lanthieri]|uniref:hypothetical protein n=1 Tax=Aliarcobacter lanthieri TaxID=1355374 RepID=UPI000478BB1A|nr:hypothetical protein [Aliarcobacter lanthieri]MBL3519589.1 hypothetical protein [Aliarcobacter lanthieri]QKF58191.1 hypothetical protein ALANTH_0050 [Aliarcobacter lanthieri]